MFKLIIADNEISNVSGIKSYIEQNFSYITVEKTFYTDEHFNTYFSSDKEYILIIDLRFFSNNFYKNLKDFKTSHPKISIIVYGKLEDIEYLKKLEQETEISYILRPVKPTNLKKALELTLYNIENKKNLTNHELSLENLYKTNYNTFKNTFLHTLTLGRIYNETEIKQSFDYFNINYSENFIVAIVRIDSFRKIIENFSDKQKHMLILKILNIVNQNLVMGQCFINLFNEIVIIFTGIDKLENILPTLTEIKLQVKTSLNLYISIGIGRPYKTAKDIKTSFNEANFALRHRFIIGKGSIISIDQVEAKNTYTANYPADREQIFVYSAVIGQYDYCIKLLDEIFEILRNSREIYETNISQFVTSILISINRTYAEKGNSNENVNKFFDTSNILKLKDLNSAYDFLKNGLKNLCNHICKTRETYENNLYQNTLNYINEKYHTQINYKSLSKILNCNQEYLKHIFEQKSGTNIYDYVNKIRIEEAKRLIMTTDLKDDTIAIKIGYEDVSIFRKTFKNLEGCLAGDFRAIHRDFKGYIK